MPQRGRPVKKWSGVIVLALYLIFYRFERADNGWRYCVFGMAREIRLPWSYDPRRTVHLPAASTFQ